MTEGRGRRLGQLAELPVSVLKGVGAGKAKALAAMGIETVLDLLTHYPRRYVDRSSPVAVSDLVAGAEAMVLGRVEHASARRIAGGRSMVQVVVSDGSGRLSLTFFNQPWRATQLKQGTEVALFGKVDTFRGTLQMASPVVDLVGDQTGRIVAVYPQSAKARVSSTELAGLVAEVLERAGELADPLPEPDRTRLGLIGRTEAFRSIHAPEEMGEWLPARRRLAFDELWRLQMALVMRKRAALREARGIRHAVGPGEGAVPGLVASFVAGLPFPLTASQQTALDEIATDLGGPHPMHRLLQGDVGAGKTVVALAALLYAVQGGHQGAFMVPTEVLAEQHFLAARALLAELRVPDEARLGGTRPVNVALLTSRTTASERTRLHAGLRSGDVDVLVGTQALLTEDVAFASLGVAVIDEQHRFGVEQRAALRERGSLLAPDGRDPDLLVMTATPIPRTAAMTVYGDLDVTELSELPPGRAPVRTTWLDDPGREHEAWERVRAEVAAGRQAYVVCPLVGAAEDEAGAGGLDDYGDDRDTGPDGDLDASSGGGRDGDLDASSGGGRDDGLDDQLDGGATSAPRLFETPPPRSSLGGTATDTQTERPPPRSVLEEHVRLSSTELAGLRVGLLHGQMPSREKESVMSAFRDGELQVLVATTVIEVGVDVTNATAIVIEDADRFGMAQLHQLRGRVGRGSEQSWCYLLATGVTKVAAARLAALERSRDGFGLAETDLALRGEGTVLGTRQVGRNDLKLASLRRDRDLVVDARAVAEAIVAGDPALESHELLADELKLFVGEEEAAYLFMS